MDLMRMAKLTPLLPKKLEELSTGDLDSITEIFGLKTSLTEEIKEAAVMLLKGRDLNTVADVVQSPESVQQLISLFRKDAGSNQASEPDRLVRCPHCRDFFLIHS